MSSLECPHCACKDVIYVSASDLGMLPEPVCVWLCKACFKVSYTSNNNTNKLATFVETRMYAKPNNPQTCPQEPKIAREPTHDWGWTNKEAQPETTEEPPDDRVTHYEIDLPSTHPIRQSGGDERKYFRDLESLRKYVVFLAENFPNHNVVVHSCTRLIYVEGPPEALYTKIFHDSLWKRSS